MREWARAGLAVASAASWAVSLTLMVAATFADDDTKLGHWSLMTALWACVATGWLLLNVERTRVETIARMLEREKEPEGLRRV